MRPLPFLAAIAATATISLATVMSAAADDGPVTIDAGPALAWGFKQSWRSYAPTPAVSDGATVLPDPGSAPYQLGWALEGGSYDAATGTTELRYRGSAHWLKYPASESGLAPPPGYDGPMDIHVLDVTLSDPVVRIAPDGATITVRARSRQLDSWEIEDLGRVEVVSLDVSAAAPTVDGGTTTWTAVPAVSSGSSNEVFAGNYPPGRAVDVVGFSYSGPGGAPDLSENWDAPGSTKLALAQNAILTEDGTTTQFTPWWLDRGNRIVHYRHTTTVDGAPAWTYRAFSLDTLQPIGEPLVLPNAETVGQPTLFETTGGRLFYRRVGEAQTSRWIRFDAGEGRYELGTLAAPIPIVGNQSLMWDAVGERAFNVRRFVPPGVPSSAHDEHQWQLNTYTEQPDGSWTAKTYDLPNFPSGLNSRGYATSTSVNAPAGVAAPDGSLILLGDRQTSSTVPAPETVPGARRIVFDPGGDTVTVEPVAGTEVPNGLLTIFKTLQGGPDGQVTLMRAANGSGPVVQDVTVAGGAATARPAVAVPGLDTLDTTDFAVDPEDGTVWVGGWQSQRIVAIRHGAVIGDQLFAERHPRGGPLLTGPGHALYAQTNDGSPAGVGGSPIFGFGRFERLGFSPAVTGQPEDAAVSLATGEQSEAVAFASTGSGDPAPERRWQVKPPGSSRFADIPGETGPTLSVDAERGLGGAQYRAVYSNPAGSIASEPATLTVAYAPRILVDVADATVEEGEQAVFQVLPEGDPDPTVTWQRRVDGFWEDVADDDNFEIDGGTLTVEDVNVDQSGALFRAKLSNAAGAVRSKVGELTVERGTGIPPGGLSLSDVTLAWSGAAELQKAPPIGGSNYFSAGVSDGTEATYAATAGEVSVRQVSAAGAETGASWLTRGAHVLAGGSQLVRLAGGDAEIEPDGSAVVRWSGAFSVNFYGGMVPFTLADPELVVDADGDGRLTADLSGYASSQADPGERTRLAPVADVTVATFSGVEVDPAGAVTVTPDYAGVEVDVPASAAPQDRTVAGWGAWPQPFVDFHLQTGLSSYWYSSGGAADQHKRPDPFVVDFAGAGEAVDPPPVDPSPPAPPGPPAPVQPAAAAPSTTTIELRRGRVPYGARARATVRVVAGTRPAIGAVRLKVGRRTARAQLADGSARIALPGRPRPGRHRVVVRYAGGDGVRSSAARATLIVAKVRPRIAARVIRPRRAGRRPVLRVRARMRGGSSAVPVGQLVVRSGARIVRVARLRRSDRGHARIRLPRLRAGTHYLRVVLTAGPLQRASASAYRSVRIGPRYRGIAGATASPTADGHFRGVATADALAAARRGAPTLRSRPAESTRSRR